MRPENAARIRRLLYAAGVVIAALSAAAILFVNLLSRSLATTGNGIPGVRPLSFAPVALALLNSACPARQARLLKRAGR